jgi:hypothetical protein
MSGHRRIDTTLRRHAAAALLSAGCLAAGGALAQSCSFRNPAPANIVFSPAFDPSVAATRTASTEFRVNCSGGASPSWSFSGANGNAPLRMKHGVLDAHIPYSAAAAYSSGPVGNQRWQVTATVTGASYIDAPVGAYSDSLIATILP